MTVPRSIQDLYSNSVNDLSAMWIDFTNKPNGTPPSVSDTGQPTNVTGTTATPTQVTNGKFVTTFTGSGATYYTIPLGANGKRIGAEWTHSANDTGIGTLCIALWDRVFTGSGTVPSARCHLTITAGNTNGFSTWGFYVGDGNGHLVLVTQGTFPQLAFDGKQIWSAECIIDEGSGNALIWLPDDSVATVTAAQIAAAIAATSGWSAGNTLASLSGVYAMVEHYGASGTPNYPAITQFWAEVNPLPRKYRATDPTRVAKAIRAINNVVGLSGKQALLVSDGTSFAIPSSGLTEAHTGLRQTFKFPKSGVVEVCAEFAFTGPTGGAWVVAGVSTSNTNSYTTGQVSILNSGDSTNYPFTGRAGAKWLVHGSPGDTTTIKFLLWCPNAQATAQFGASSGTFAYSSVEPMVNS